MKPPENFENLKSFEIWTVYGFQTEALTGLASFGVLTWAKSSRSFKREG